ncbi:MAG: lipoate--protein ligase [Desulfovibrionaceae bacterium]|nr:lipoate--protein ligase [Desulfovibrionaceae bacterium]
MLGLRLDTLEPALNLALEEHLLLNLPAGHPGLFLLWQNSPSVIVGRHQCTAEEVNSDFIRQEALPVVRRMTGGGAVYHDLGNLNFSFISHAPHGTWRPDFARYLEPVCRALRDVGVMAVISGRNDLEADGRKISGSGQRLWRGRVLHHGTLLVQADIARMGRALSPDMAKIRSKGVASVRARVGNLADIWQPGTDMEALRACLLRHCATGQTTLRPQDMACAEALAESKYRQWSWNYGASPAFDEVRKQRFPWGSVCLRLAVRQGRITACRITGDFFAQGEMEELEAMLIGHSREPAGLRRALASLDWRNWFSGCEPAAMLDFFAQ